MVKIAIMNAIQPIESPTFSIIVPTLGNHEMIQRVLCSSWPPLYLRRQRSWWYTTECHPALRFIRTTGSYGIARANNSGFNASHGQYIVFIHDDLLILQKDWLNTFRRILDEHPEVGMVGGSEAKFIDRSPEEASWIEAGILYRPDV